MNLFKRALMGLCTLLFFSIGTSANAYTHIFENKNRYGAKLILYYYEKSGCKKRCKKTLNIKLASRETYVLRGVACPLYRIEAWMDDPRQEKTANLYLAKPYLGDGTWLIGRDNNDYIITQIKENSGETRR